MSTPTLARFLGLVLIAAPAAATDLLVSSRFSDNVLRFREDGSFVGLFASGHGMDNPNGIAFGPDGNLYVGLGDVGKVLRFHGSTGAFIDEFVNDPLNPGCRAIAFGTDGHLYVDAGGADQVVRYDAATRARTIFAQGHGMDGPVGLTQGPDGSWYVGAALSNTVHVFDANGAFLRSFSVGLALSNATGVLFHPDGSLLVAGSVTNTIGRFDPLTGVPQGIFASGNGLNIPINMIFTPGGDLLVGSFGTDSIRRFGPIGERLGAFVLPGTGGLDGTHNMAFMPVPAPGGVALFALAACRRRVGR